MTSKGKPRQQRNKLPAVTCSTRDVGDFGDSEGVRLQARAAQSKSGVAVAGAAEIKMDVDGHMNNGACPPAPPDMSNASGDCTRRPKRSATSSLPCAKGSSNVTATDACADAATPTCSSTLASEGIRRPDSGKSRFHPAQGMPTADDLNDPIFRAKLKARVKAKAKILGDEEAIGGSSGGGGGGGICASASRPGCGRKVRDSTGVSRAAEVERDDEAGRGFGRWISSRKDWCVGDVSGRRASSGVTKDSASASSSKQQLSSRVKSSSASGTPTSPKQPKQQKARQKNTPLSAASRSGARGSSRRWVEAPHRSASVENGAAVAPGPSARYVVDFVEKPRGGKVVTVTTTGKGVKRARSDDSVERNCNTGGSGRLKDQASATEVVAGVGVGPRSHAKMRRRNAAVQRGGQDCASVETTAAVAKVISPPRDHLPSARGRAKKASGVKRAAAKTCPRRNGTPTREEHVHSVAAPANVISASSVTPVSRAGQRQRHGSGGGGGSGGRARGQEMVRQARDRGETADRRAARGSTEGQEQDAANTITFRGFRFVLVGLPVDAGKEVEEKILAGGGALIDEIPSDPRGELWLPTEGRGKGIARSLVAPGGEGAAAAVATNSSRRKVNCAPQHTSPEEEVDVVVVVSLLAASREPEYVLAIATGTPLVHRLWVDDSAAQGQPLPAGPYLLPGAREASRRRQVVGGDGRRVKNGGSMAAGAARLATARVVTKPGTPLTGMKVGVAHPSLNTCERWGRVLTAAGAQVVRLISAPLLLMDGEISTGATAETVGMGIGAGVAVKARSRRTTIVDNSRSSGHKNSRGREGKGCGFGVDGGEPVRPAPASALRAAFVGLDCVVCDYPGVWRGSLGCTILNGVIGLGTGPVEMLESDSSAPSPRARLGRDGKLWSGSGTLALERARSPSCRRTELQTHGGDAMLMLKRVVVAATREGVRLVSLSWVTDCAIRGTRIKQQSRPEYLSPFLDVSLGGREPPRIAAGAGSAVKPHPPMSAVASGIQPTPLRAFLAMTGERYEVNDFVRYSAREDNFAGSGSRRSSSRGLEEPPGRDDRVGRVVSLEMTPSGRVFVTLEPLREKQWACPSSSPSTFSAVVGMETSLSATAGKNGAFLRRAKGGVFTRPSNESSVLRSRERRACELMKVAAKGSVDGSYGIQKKEATCLRGRVCVVTMKEFESRGGYCGRDPDVYVQRKVLSLGGSVL